MNRPRTRLKARFSMGLYNLRCLRDPVVSKSLKIA